MRETDTLGQYARVCSGRPRVWNEENVLDTMHNSPWFSTHSESAVRHTVYENQLHSFII
jgi:hypothetical protein